MEGEQTPDNIGAEPGLKLPSAPIIEPAPLPTFEVQAAEINEALLIAGLRQHELTEEAEKLNAQLRVEIAERRHVEDALLESERGVKAARDYAEATLRTMPVPFLVLRADLRVNSASDAFYRNFDVAPAETEGCLIYELGNGQWDIPKLRTLLEDILPQKSFFNGYEVTHAFETLGHRTMLLNARRLDSADGTPERILLAIEDITERKRAEETLRLAMAEIEQGSRAKDDFLAALSHELRTPLTPVLMTAAALESDPALPIEVRDQLAMMRRNIELEAQLIDDLLDVTRISRGKLRIAPVAADLHELLGHTAEIVRSDGFSKQVRIVFALDAARHHALVDPTRLQQIFWNLFKNALKFTPTGGSITVSTRNDAEDWIFLSFEDTGIGISAEALPHVFNAFEQGDISGSHRYGGLGLGLAISRAIVEVHGGTIRAESEGAGCGATFTLALATVDAPAASPRASAPLFSPARALRLLIVEDHEATRTVLTRLLGRNGHHITSAGTMCEALAAFVAGHFDAVISDLGLPDGSGLEMIREMQSLRPVPAIALSGYGMEEDLRQTKEAGFFAHLVKPVHLDQLRVLLDQIPVGQ